MTKNKIFGFSSISVLGFCMIYFLIRDTLKRCLKSQFPSESMMPMNFNHRLKKRFASASISLPKLMDSFFKVKCRFSFAVELSFLAKFFTLFKRSSLSLSSCDLIYHFLYVRDARKRFSFRSPEPKSNLCNVISKSNFRFPSTAMGGKVLWK